MMRNAIVLIGLTALAAGCGGDNEDTTAANDPMATPPTQEAPVTPQAAASRPLTVQLEPTEGNTVSGALSVSAGGEGVRITGTLTGFEPNSEHAIHIHENGDCSAPDASSAGGHFAPLDNPHGAPGYGSHVGDMGNITADAQGMVQVDVRAVQATLGGMEPTNVMGKAIIVHAGADDLKSQPSGNAGARLACGVIAE